MPTATQISKLLRQLDEREQALLLADMRRSLDKVEQRRIRAENKAARKRQPPGPYGYSEARRAICATLLQACRDAHRGQEGAWEWIDGPEARHMAELVDLTEWPPTRDQVEQTLARQPKRGSLPQGTTTKAYDYPVQGRMRVG